MPAVTPEEAQRQLQLWMQERERLLAPQREAEERQRAREEHNRQVQARAAHWNQVRAQIQPLVRQNQPNQAVPANQLPSLTIRSNNPRNSITDEQIEEGNVLVNFRGDEPNSFESTYNRYYKETTIPRIVDQKHPHTRGTMHNQRRVRAHIVAPGSNARRRRRRSTRKSRRASRRSNRK